MYQDGPTKDLTELSQDFSALEKSVKRILFRRVLLLILLTVALFGASIILSINTDADSRAEGYLIVWILFWIGTATAAELIIEIIAFNYRPRWYQYMNFFIWNITGQIGLLVSRQEISGARRSLASSVIGFKPRQAIDNAYDLSRAHSSLKANEIAFNNTFIVDRYLTLKYAQADHGKLPPNS